MNVASLELSKELYELSGWGETHFVYARSSEYKQLKVLSSKSANTQDHTTHFPAYDLGYLLRKLPRELKNGAYLQMTPSPDEEWEFGYAEYGEIPNGNPQASSDTPEDAACSLAIELIKQGVLK